MSVLAPPACPDRFRVSLRRTLASLCAIASLWAMAPPTWAQSATSAVAVGNIVELPGAEVVGRARPAAKVVMLSMEQFPAESWPEVERRAAGELRAYGLEAVSLPSRAADVPTRLAELGAKAASHNAVAAIRIVRKGKTRRAQVWIYDAITGKMVLRETKPAAPGPQAAKSLALQVVELLNATLIELHVLRRKGVAAAAPRPVERWVERTLAPPPGPRRFFLFAGPALLTAVGGVGTAGGIALGGGVRTWPWLSAVAELFLPFLTPSSSGATGEADVLPLSIRASARVQPWPDLIVSPQFLLSVGVMLAQARGHATPPFVSATEWGATIQLGGGLRLTHRLTQTVEVGVQLSVGAVVPEINIELGGSKVDRIGPLVLDSTLGLEWRWGQI